MTKKPVILPQIGEGFDYLFDTLANTPTPTEHTPKERIDKHRKASKNKLADNKEQK